MASSGAAGDWKEQGSFAAEERKLITDRLKELDTLEKDQKLFIEEQKKKEDEISERKLEVQRKMKAVQANIQKSLQQENSLRKQQTTKKKDFDLSLEILKGKETEARQKIAHLEQEIDKEEKKTFPATLPHYSDCTVCMDRILPPKQIFHCMEGHLICNSCRDKLPYSNKCPTCRVTGSFSRCRSLEGLRTKVEPKKKLSLKERMAAISLSVGVVDDLNDKIEILNNELRSIGVQIVVTRESFEKWLTSSTLSSEISVVEKELFTLRQQESDLQSELGDLEFELGALVEYFKRNMADMKSQQNKNKISTMLGFQNLDIRLNMGTSRRDSKEGILATHIVTFSVEVDGWHIDIQIFLSGSPNTANSVKRFLQLCNSQYKDSIFHLGARKTGIEGGLYKSSGRNMENSLDYATDSNYSRQCGAGDVVMLHGPKKGTKYNAWFAIIMDSCVRRENMVRIGIVQDTSPLEYILRETNYAFDVVGGNISNQIIITDIYTQTLLQPIPIPH